MCSLTSLAGPKRSKAPAKEKARPTAPAPATPYIGLLPTTSDSEEYAPLLARANELLKAEYEKYELDYVPEGESEQASAEVARSRKIEGVRLRLILTAAREQMRASLLVTKIPGGGLRGSWFVHASGPDNVELLEAIVPAIVADVAADLKWTKKVVAAEAPASPPASPVAAAEAPVAPAPDAVKQVEAEKAEGEAPTAAR